MSEARTKHYANSLAWDDKGARLLTVANYEHYTELMDGLRDRVVRQRARFIEDYDDYVDQARLDLGKLFRIEDYPSKEDLQGKFAIRYRITPVPDADHFIAQLASDDTERVKRDIERHVEEQLHGAVGELYRRFGEAVERVSERLREDDDGKPLVFRDTMISNIRNLVDVVPRLNIFGDHELAQLCEQVKEKIASVEPDALRPSKTFDPAARAQVKRDADELAESSRVISGRAPSPCGRPPDVPRGDAHAGARPRVHERPRAEGLGGAASGDLGQPPRRTHVRRQRGGGLRQAVLHAGHAERDRRLVARSRTGSTRQSRSTPTGRPPWQPSIATICRCRRPSRSSPARVATGSSGSPAR